MRMKSALAFWGILLIGTVQADSPGMIHYQGRLVQGTNLYSGSVNIVFRMYDAPTGGTLLHTSTNAATAVDGLYATVIGEHVVAGNLNAALTNAQVWLEVQVNGTTLSPRERVLAVPYARAVYGMRVEGANNIVLNAEVGGNTTLFALHSAIGGGSANRIHDSWYATISGGRSNQINSLADLATTSGGFANEIGENASYATISGGRFNKVSTNASHAVIGGGSMNEISRDAPYSMIGGGFQNHIGIGATNSTISGGDRNRVDAGSENTTISGGRLNQVGLFTDGATIGGGLNNQIQGYTRNSTIGGGMNNTVGTSSWYATVAGGEDNQIGFGSSHSTVSGGFSNRIQQSAFWSTIPGGYENRVGPNASSAFAAGYRAVANHLGAFVWSDFSNPGSEVISAGDNSVTFRAAGGYQFFSNPLMTLGAQLAPNATAWSAISDRNAKEKIEPIEPERVLEGVKQMPLSEWQYKADPSGRRYIGPMAQDFHALFGLGDDKTINTLDADGVLFAAVQALARENELLRQRLEELEKRISETQQQAH